MNDSRTAFLEAIKHFASWMDIRKRPFKSDGGHFLRSIIEEQDSIQQALADFKKDFFILSYIGREHTVIDYMYAAQVGEIGDSFKLTSPVASITTNAKKFLQSTEPIALWQEGYLLFRLNLIPPNDLTVRYTIDDFTYSSAAVKFHVWNVLDEFAMFSGLKRYEDETNAELLKRTLLAYKNPTNSTELGIKNSIINSVSSYANLDPEDITIETPNEDNLNLPDEEFGTIYERIAQFNKDMFRTKKWNIDTWEHNFKSLEYLPHIWDAKIDVHQNGVGQNNSLQTILTGELQDQETTDAQITGYQKSDIEINEYIRSQRIEANLDLALKKYNNILKAKDVEYKISASEVKELEVSDISVECYKQAIGEEAHYLADLMIDPRGATVIPNGVLSPNSKYRVKFYPSSAYSSMLISKANLVNPDSSLDTLLVDNGVYKKVNGIFQNTDVSLHAISTKQFKTFNSIIDVRDGVTLDGSMTTGSFSVDITGMGGKLIKLGHSCRPVDITKNTAFVKPNGFTVSSDDKLVANGTDSTSNIIIDLDCNYITFELESAVSTSLQGSCTVILRVDGVIDTSASGLWSTGRKLDRTFNKLSHVKVEIQKTGMNPVIIKNIMTSRYEVSYRLEKGTTIVTPFSTMLPILPATEQNTLYVDVKAYSAFAPVVNYVHVGSSLGNAVYVTKDIVTGAASCSLDISSNCIVKLYKVTGTAETLVSDNLITKSSYRNDTSGSVSLIIDTSRFLAITRSTPVIEHTTEAGNVVNYITLLPGQTIDQITIDGSSLVLVESNSLHKLICPSTGSYKVFVGKALKGFILQNTSSLDETLVHLTRNKLNGSADVFKFKNIPLGVTGSFIVDKVNKVETISNSFDHNFEEVYMFPTESQEYIAYNKVTALKNIYQGVSIVDTFMPLIPPNTNLVYVIGSITNPNLTATALFEKVEAGVPTFINWSLGPKTIRVEVDMGYSNNNSYELELKQLSQKFVISNNIDLDVEYDVEGQTIELAEYVITPPANMRIAYESKDYSEKFNIEEDGFNKLTYSNISYIEKVVVAGATIPKTSYELMGEEGIVIWKNDSYDGKEAAVYYKYDAPKYLSYTSLEHLYALAGYSIEAYKVINTEPISLHNLTDGSVAILDFGMAAGQYPDKVIIRCTNPNFQAKVEDGNVLKVAKSNIDNVVAVKTGFFYDKGLEYYQFNNKHTDLIDPMNNIELHHIHRLNNALVFIQSSVNYVLDSAMRVRRTGELCNLDFVNNTGIRGLSRIDSLTACDSYNSWIDFDMEISFKTGLNGMALSFSSNSDDSYAIMDISRFVKSNTLITLSASGPLTVRIAKEVKHRDNSYKKALFASPHANMLQSGSYQYFVFGDDYDPSYRYFLLLTGSGILDDIVIKDYIAGEVLRTVHSKNIDLLGLSVAERPKTNYTHRLMFDVNGNQFNNLELDGNGVIQPGSNVDWGLTKIYDARSNWSGCTTADIKVGKEAMYSQDGIGIITTPAIYLRNKQSIKSLIVKVNDVLVGNLTDFNITISTGNQPTATFNEAVSLKKTNVVQAPQNKLLSHVKIMVEMPAGRVINNIEVFAEYAETNVPLHIATNKTGDITTKVYDIGYMAKLKVLGLDVKGLDLPNKVRVSIRACREDAEHAVWTSWKDLRVDSNMKVIGDAPVFENYRLFQFKIYLDNELAKIAIGSFNFEVVG